jgi:hypothetical protein
MKRFLERDKIAALIRLRVSQEVPMSAPRLRDRVRIAPAFSAPLITFIALGAVVVAVQATQAGGDKTVLAVAVDAKGAPIKDIGAQDWGVREDGANRQIVDVKPAPAMQMVVLVDTTRGIEQSVRDVRTGVTSFVHAIQAGSPDSVIAVMSVSGAQTMLVDFGKSAADMDKALGRIFPDQSQSTTFLEAFPEALKRLAKMPASPRRVLVSLNLEGFPESSQIQPQLVANAVLASGVSMWSVSFRNVASISTSASAEAKGGGIGSGNVGQNRDMILNNLTGQTGGTRLTVNAASAIEASLGEIANLLLAQYSVTYKRPEGPAPAQLQIAVARPGARVLIPRVPPK